MLPCLPLRFQFRQRPNLFQFLTGLGVADGNGSNLSQPVSLNGLQQAGAGGRLARNSTSKVAMALEIVPPRKSALKAPTARKSPVADANIDVTRTATVEASASNEGLRDAKSGRLCGCYVLVEMVSCGHLILLGSSVPLRSECSHARATSEAKLLPCKTLAVRA